MGDVISLGVMRYFLLMIRFAILVQEKLLKKFQKENVASVPWMMMDEMMSPAKEASVCDLEKVEVIEKNSQL